MYKSVFLRNIFRGQEIKGHRLELKDINCENWLKLRGGGKTISGGPNASPEPPLKTVQASDIIFGPFTVYHVQDIIHGPYTMYHVPCIIELVDSISRDE